MQKAHKKNFGWIVKDEDIPQMYQGIIPLPLYHAVLSMVHPSVAMELQGISKRKSDGYAFIQVDQPRALTAEAVINEDCSYTLWKQPEETMSTRELSQKSDIKLFDCFPLIRKVVRSHRTDYKLFNLIPIVKLSHKGIKFKCTLFGLIPLFSSIKKNWRGWWCILLPSLKCITFPSASHVTLIILEKAHALSNRIKKIKRIYKLAKQDNLPPLRILAAMDTNH